MISRREFLLTLARTAPALGGMCALLSFDLWPCLASMDRIRSAAFAADGLAGLTGEAPAARYWTSVTLARGNCLACHSAGDAIQKSRYQHEPNIVKCLLCAQECIIRDGKRGKCRSRQNVQGQLKSLVYGRPVTIHTDPIEKKPFYHFLPGAAAFSLATTGCPLRCKFCQNWEISQASPEDFKTPYASPAALVQASRDRGAPVIAFTYNEPTVFMEYMTDIARSARKQKTRSVLISCGFMNEAPLDELCQVLDAIKIDLKGYSSSFYRDVCGAELKPVLQTIKTIARRRIHLEIVNLVVPTLNDSDKMMQGLIDWIMGEIGPDVPVHFTRFHPNYQLLNLPPTPVATLERAWQMAMEKGMHFAYVGNVPNHAGNHTYCPSCKKIVIKRTGFFIETLNIKDGRCSFCRRKLAGVWT